MLTPMVEVIYLSQFLRATPVDTAHVRTFSLTTLSFAVTCKNCAMVAYD